MQPQPAVAAKDRDAFGEIVERFALNADQFLKTPLKIEALGDVVEEVGDPTVRIGGGDDAQSAPVGQMPGMFVGFDGAISLVQLRLPLAKILLLRQLARRAQDLDHRRIGRALIEEAGIEIPQGTIGGIVESQPMVAVKHGDAGGKLIERAAMRVGEASERAAQRFHFGGVHADAGAAGLGTKIEHVKSPARAGDDGAQPAGIGATAPVLLRDVFARGAVEQFQAALDGVGGALGFDGARIGGVDEGQIPLRVARPQRRRQFFGERPQRGEFGRHCFS